MNAEFFSGLRNFLPKYVPLRPAYKSGTVAFLIVIILGVVGYAILGKKSKSVPNESARGRKFEETKEFMSKFVYSVVIVGVASLAAQTAFNSKFFWDSKKINGDWNIYRQYFPALFR